MFGFNETAEMNSLLELIRESRKWILRVNRAILKTGKADEAAKKAAENAAIKMKEATEAEKAASAKKAAAAAEEAKKTAAKKAAEAEAEATAAEEECLDVALQVLKACCINRYCVDFLGGEASGVRRSFELLAASRKEYKEEEDEYICGRKEAPEADELLGGPPSLKDQKTLKSDSLSVKTVSESILMDSLPDGKQPDEYEKRYLMMMQIHPMYEVIRFAEEIIRGVRAELMQFEGKRNNGRYWQSLTKWAEEENSRDEAVRLCRQVCRDALKKRTGRSKKNWQIEPFRHQGKPPRFLDIFDNQYSILSEMAGADTTGRSNGGKVQVYSALCGSRMCRTMKKSFDAEDVLLAIYLWNRIGRMQAESEAEEQKKRSGIWVSIEGGKEGFGVYGDKRIAASGFVKQVEEAQKSAGKDQLMEFFRIGGVTEVSLTPLANDIFTKKLHAVSLSAIVAALIYRKWISLNEESSETPLTSLWFRVITAAADKMEMDAAVIIENEENRSPDDAGADGEKNDGKNRTEIYLPGWLWEAVKYENRRGQDYLRLNDKRGSVALTQRAYLRCSRWMETKWKDGSEALMDHRSEIEAESDVSQETGENPTDAGKKAETNTPNHENPERFMNMLLEIGWMNQMGDEEIRKGRELLYAKCMIIRYLDILLIDGMDDGMADSWDKLKRLIEWLDVTEVDDKRNNPYMILMNHEESTPVKTVSAVDVLLWKFVQGDMPKDIQRYSEAVWRMADKAGAMIANILDGPMEAKENFSSLKNVKKYGPAALGGDTTDGMKNQSSTWWMTRVMRSTLAFLYRDEEVTPSFALEKRKWDGEIDFDEILARKVGDTGNVLWIRDRIADRFLGIKWETLSKQHDESPDESGKKCYEPDAAIVEKSRAAFEAFCKERNSRQWRTEVLDAGNARYCIRVTERTLTLGSGAAAWVKSCGETDDSWMDKPEEMKCFKQYVRQQWLDVVCDARRKQEENEEKAKSSGKTLKLIKKKQRALAAALLAAKDLADARKLQIQSVTTAVYPPDLKDSDEQNAAGGDSLGFKMKFRDGKEWTFSDVCCAIEVLKREYPAAYKEYRKGLQAKSVQATTKNLEGEGGRITWNVTRQTLK